MTLRWFDFLRHKHRWVKFDDGFKRRCHCGAKQWVMGNPFPAIGEAAYDWRDMTRPTPSQERKT